MSDKIIVKFSGGLGNQLFDYMFYEWLKQEFPDRVILADLTYYKVNNPHNSMCLWDVFPRVEIEKAGFGDLFTITGLIPVFYKGPFKHRIDSIRERINSRFFHESELVYKYDGDWISPENAREVIIKGFKYLDSYWQDIAFYQSMRSVCQSKLEFTCQNVVGYEQEMKRQNAVSMHVRRGDYVNSVFDKEVGLPYYKKAIEYICTVVENPHFYIFSDDKDYVKKEYAWLKEKTIVEGFDDRKSHIDMYLMSMTPNSIITNSTFSLWAAYLNKNATTIVYPNVDYMTHKVMMNWVGIESK